MTMLALCVLLLVVGLALVFLEMFIPSAGVLGFLSAAMIVLSVVLAYYYYGPLVGTIFLAIGAIVTPIVIAVALRWYPHTTLGQLVMPLPPAPEEVLPLATVTGELQRLKGQVGKTLTPLLPGGSVKVEGKIYNAVSDGEPIEAASLVLVTSVDGTRIIVRHVEESQFDTPREAEPAKPLVTDVLSQPIEALGLESLEDPLA
jgi:membrane-bound serine protease (ClpP class)